MSNTIVETYSDLAEKYDEEANQRSCWGLAAEKALGSLRLKEDYRLVLDVGCGTGQALARLASQSQPDVQFIGIDPAENMRRRALQRCADHGAVKILDGSFENIPLPAASVDYLYSILAFHWVADLAAALREISRVLKPGAEMDLFFIGRHNGREFIRVTSPIFLKYMGPALFLESTRMRKQLTKDAAFELFSQAIASPHLTVEESQQTYYDTLEGHWGWWVRIEGHFIQIPPERRDLCNREVRRALETLAEQKGIPYTIHQLHVRLRRA